MDIGTLKGEHIKRGNGKGKKGQGFKALAIGTFRREKFFVQASGLNFQSRKCAGSEVLML